MGKKLKVSLEIMPVIEDGKLRYDLNVLMKGTCSSVLVETNSGWDEMREVDTGFVIRDVVKYSGNEQRLKGLNLLAKTKEALRGKVEVILPRNILVFTDELRQVAKANNNQIPAHLKEWYRDDMQAVLDGSPTNEAIVRRAFKADHVVTTMHTKAQEEIGDGSTNVFGRETNQKYRNMPIMSNLEADYSISSYGQVRHMLEVVNNGGIAIPLVHPNTLFQNDNPNTQGFLHAIVLTGFNATTQSFSVIDANPGFSSIPAFARRKEEGKLKIPSNRIHSVEMADRVASRFHPKKSVIYEVSVSSLESALRSVSTTISA